MKEKFLIGSLVRAESCVSCRIGKFFLIGKNNEYCALLPFSNDDFNVFQAKNLIDWNIESDLNINPRYRKEKIFKVFYDRILDYAKKSNTKTICSVCNQC